MSGCRSFDRVSLPFRAHIGSACAPRRSVSAVSSTSWPALWESARPRCDAPGMPTELKPHLVDTLKVSRDPQFVEKLEDIVGLYLNPAQR